MINGILVGCVIFATLFLIGQILWRLKQIKERDKRRIVEAEAKRLRLLNEKITELRAKYPLINTCWENGYRFQSFEPLSMYLPE